MLLYKERKSVRPNDDCPIEVVDELDQHAIAQADPDQTGARRCFGDDRMKRQGLPPTPIRCDTGSPIGLAPHGNAAREERRFYFLQFGIQTPNR